jgi:hypothetical protein
MPKLYVKGIWERGTFTVPDDAPDDKVQAKFSDYKRDFGKILERQGFTVLEMTSPTSSKSVLKTEPGQKRYDLYARVIRKPEIVRLSVPDIAVPMLLKNGLQLVD